MNRNSILITFAMLSAFLPSGCEEELPRAEPIRPVLAMKVDDATALTGQWVPGRAKATQEVDLSFEVPGKIIDRPVFVGDEVTEGQIIAQLDPRDYENDLQRAQAESDRAKAQFERVELAAKSGAIGVPGGVPGTQDKSNYPFYVLRRFGPGLQRQRGASEGLATGWNMLGIE